MAHHRVEATIEYLWYWMLNPMQGRTEARTQFGPYDTCEKALEFIEEQRCEPYQEVGADMFTSDGKKMYRKSFLRGGPLELYNPCSEAEIEEPGLFGHGLHRVINHVEVTTDYGPI